MSIRTTYNTYARYDSALFGSHYVGCIDGWAKPTGSAYNSGGLFVRYSGNTWNYEGLWFDNSGYFNAGTYHGALAAAAITPYSAYQWQYIAGDFNGSNYQKGYLNSETAESTTGRWCTTPDMTTIGPVGGRNGPISFADVAFWSAPLPDWAHTYRAMGVRAIDLPLSEPDMPTLLGYQPLVSAINENSSYPEFTQVGTLSGDAEDNPTFIPLPASFKVWWHRPLLGN